MHKIRQFWFSLTSSLWFVPLGMVVVAIVLAIILSSADLLMGDGWTAGTIIFAGGAAGARSMLSAIASSMITVASLTFSLTIFTLAAAASQYTSRLIRNFMRDRINQFVLGYFVGLFAYCLVVLRIIHDAPPGEDTTAGAFASPVAVLGGLVLALFSIVVLIYFIHHIASSIQVATILDRGTRQTLAAIDNLFPENVGEPAGPNQGDDGLTRSCEQSLPPAARWYPIRAERFGYVESLNPDALIAAAIRCESLVRMTADIGAFVTPMSAICEIALTSEPRAEAADEIRGCFTIGPARTTDQDVAFGIRQIVDIALKALSPGVNDTTTAVMCVEHLSVLLETMAAREIPDRIRAEDGVVRVIASGRTFTRLTGLAFDQIRQSAADNPAVLSALLHAIAAASRGTVEGDRLADLDRHAKLIAELAERSIGCRDDLEPVEQLVATVRDGLKGPATAPPVIVTPERP